MLKLTRVAVTAAAALLVVAACSAGSSPSPSPTTGAASPSAGGASPSAGGASPSAAASVDPNDLLAKIQAAGEIKVGTDPNYAPQSFLKSDGTFEGFDIDVANEIAERLGVTAKFETPDFAVVEAGGWAGRFDISVGSVTITEARKEVLDFTEPYYFTPAQMSATTASGITSLEGLAGKTICVAEGTTYFQWLEGNLVLGDGSTTSPVPAGAKATTLKTDQDCAQSVQSGRTDFEGFLTSATTLKEAIDNGAPLVAVGDPVFYEPLAVATDKEGPAHDALQAELDRIVTEMHEDGTLTEFSKKWYDGQDLTVKQ
jgi:polar amino acid transport system substrate-binding protein